MAGVRPEACGRLPKSRRILTPAAYAAVFKRGRKIQDPLFTVFAAAGVVAHARIGLAVSRKVSPRAVVRNRIKRQVRESFRRNQAALTGLDLVVVARPPAAAGAGPSLRASLQQHWEEITRKCKKS